MRGRARAGRHSRPPAPAACPPRSRHRLPAPEMRLRVRRPRPLQTPPQTPFPRKMPRAKTVSRLCRPPQTQPPCPRKKAAARRFWPAAGFAALGVLCAGAGTAAAALLHTDYGAVGVLCVLLFYALHRWRWLAALAAVGALCAMDVSEVFALAAVPLIGLYSGQRGLRLKYVFYAFYPAHLLLLWGIASAMSLI